MSELTVTTVDEADLFDFDKLFNERPKNPTIDFSDMKIGETVKTVDLKGVDNKSGVNNLRQSIRSQFVAFAKGKPELTGVTLRTKVWNRPLAEGDEDGENSKPTSIFAFRLDRKTDITSDDIADTSDDSATTSTDIPDGSVDNA